MVQGLKAQSFGQGTSQMTGMGRMASRHNCFSTYSPGKTEAIAFIRGRVEAGVERFQVAEGEL